MPSPPPPPPAPVPEQPAPASQTPNAPNRPLGAPVTTTSKPPHAGNQYGKQRGEAKSNAKKPDNKKRYIIGGVCGLAVIGIIIVAAIAAIVINKKRAKRRLQLEQPHPSLAMGQKPKSGITTHSTRSTRSGIRGKRGKNATELPVPGGPTEFFSK
jgi:hypothetical protein